MHHGFNFPIDRGRTSAIVIKDRTFESQIQSQAQAGGDLLSPRDQL